jgi:nicotinamidase-related amidase
MIIPDAAVTKALFIIDVQPLTLKGDLPLDKLFHVRKTTRSCFKGFDPEALKAFLRQRKIEEIHFVGFDINDCVLASAYEAIDSGYYSFILEELSHQQTGIQELADAALTIFRSQRMTNNSLHKKIRYKEVDLED